MKNDLHIYELLPDNTRTIELSPVGTLGANTLLGQVDIKNVLTTSRGNEVMADATTALALEWAIMRKNGNMNTLRLATHHRIIRWQKFDQEWFTPHFRAFHYCLLWRQTDRMNFEFDALKESIELYLRILQSFKQEGFWISDIKVKIANLMIAEKILAQYPLHLDKKKELMRNDVGIFPVLNFSINSHVKTCEELNEIENYLHEKGVHVSFNTLRKIHQYVLVDLKKRFPDVTFLFDVDRVKWSGYYDGLSMHISAKTKDDLEMNLVDGGFSNWTEEILGDKKEKFFASWLGTELFYKYFK